MEFPFKIYFYRYLVQICVGLFKPLYFRKYNAILDYLADDQSGVIEKYKSVEPDFTGKEIPKRIWVLWWQNDSAIPPVPQKCIERIQSFSEYDVVVINSYNVSSYINLSDVMPLYEAGRIKVQFLSDIIRARLLYKYGGFWCDSTLAIIDNSFFDDIIRNYRFHSIKLKDLPSWCSVSRGYFSAYFWASVPGNPFFGFLNDMLTGFILKHGQIIDYYQIDFSIMTGYYNIPFIKQLIDRIEPSNPDIFQLGGLINKKYNESKWNSLIAANQIFKLSWRTIPRDKTRKGEPTFWGMDIL